VVAEIDGDELWESGDVNEFSILRRFEFEVTRGPGVNVRWPGPVAGLGSVASPVVDAFTLTETFDVICMNGVGLSTGTAGTVNPAGIGSLDEDLLRADKVGGSALTSSSSTISGNPGGRAIRGKAGGWLFDCGRDRMVRTGDDLGPHLPVGTLWDSRREPNWLMSTITCVDR